MDREFSQDLEEDFQNLQGAEVVSLFFPLLGQTLLVDLRHNEGEPPLVKVVAMMRTPEERLRSVRRLRPHFPRPRRLALIPWWGSIEGVVRCGLYDHLLEQVAASGHSNAVKACREALTALRRLERANLTALIRGENAHTLWAREG